MNCDAGISNETREILHRITPNFRENLKRAFINEGIRADNKSNQEIKLDDVFLTKDGTQIELHHLKLIGRPDFRISKLEVDLFNFSLDFSINLGNLRIQGDYSATNISLQRWLPVSNKGKISFDIEKVSCIGTVGLYIREDSFCAENFDLSYSPAKITIKATYGESDARVENQISEIDLESTLANAFWVELCDKITKLFKRQLGAVIVEYSVQELMLDQHEDIRNVSNQRYLRANRLIDTLLFNGKSRLVSMPKGTVVPVEALVKNFEKKPPYEGLGFLETKEGFFDDLSTLSRRRDFSLLQNDEGIVVFGDVSLAKFKLTYEKFDCQWKDMNTIGKIVAKVYKNEVFLKVQASKHGNEFLVKNIQVQIRNLDDIELEIYNLGSMVWLENDIKSWVVGHLRSNIFQVERSIREALEYATSLNSFKTVLSSLY